MATPPFENTRLNPHETLDKAKQEELFDAITRNIEDTYRTFSTAKELQEQKKAIESNYLRLVGGVARKASFGVATVTFPGGNRTSNTTTVPHDLGATPIAILTSMSPGSTFGCIPETISGGATTFGIRAFCAAGEPTAGQNISVSWLTFA